MTVTNWIVIAMFVLANGGAILFAAGRITAKMDMLAESFQRQNADNDRRIHEVHQRINKVEDTQTGHGERIAAVETKVALCGGKAK